MSLPALRRGLQKRLSGRGLLWLLSVLYGSVVIFRRFLYDARVLKQQELGVKVVCIGNLTTGGTGKTPAVLLAAQTLRRRGHGVAILSRGYGRAAGGPEVAVLEDGSPLDWTQCGDEPWMMGQTLRGQGVPILVGADRAQAGRKAVAAYRPQVVILDDGFSHRRLRRDLDIVLVNAAAPFGAARLLPAGELREPLSSLRRAHMVLLTHVDLAAELTLAAIKAEILKINPRLPILESVHKADFLLDVRASAKLPLDRLQGRSAVALSGLADPASFEEQLTRLGAGLAHRWRYPDHHRYTREELASLEHLRAGLPLVTTFKDLTRFPKGWEDVLSGEVYALAIKLEILKGANRWTDSLIALAGGKS